MNRPAVLVGVSAAIRELDEEIQFASRSDAKVLITGESGVGKEIVARLIHQRSQRAAGPLVTINCAGFPDTLLESEMFGHVRGSFTDAHRDKRGWLEMANGGTIFMDEIGEMSLRMQAMMLRFLETGEIQRVGSHDRQSTVDVRVIAATHRQLLDKVQERTFREDLYYRLNVMHLQVPPLRERREDIVVLLQHFLGEFAATHKVQPVELTGDALGALVAYPWPGNVRELRNIGERLVLRSPGALLDVGDLPPEILSANRESRRAAEQGPSRPVHDVLLERISGGESFWTVVRDPLLARDLTRSDVRELVREGLDRTHGDYRALLALLHLTPDDYKPFMAFLRKHQCHIPSRPANARRRGSAI